MVGGIEVTMLSREVRWKGIDARMGIRGASRGDGWAVWIADVCGLR